MAKAISDEAVLGGREEMFTVGLRHADGTATRLLKVGYATNDCSYYVFFRIIRTAERPYSGSLPSTTLARRNSSHLKR